MKILDRYILRSFLYSYVLSLLVLISLYVVLDLFVNFDEFTESDKTALQSIRDIIDFYGYNVPMYFSQLSGVITAFAACATMARLHRQNEITAVLASGTSLFRIVAPIVIASLAMNGLLVLDQEFLLPSVAPKLARPRDDVSGMRSTNGIWCVRDGENRLLSAQYFSPYQKRVRGLVIVELNRQGNQPARLGDVITASKARWDSKRHGWDLTDNGTGYGVRVQVAEAVAAGITSETPVRKVAVDFYPAELDPEQLRSRQTAQWVQFLSVRQLNELMNRPDMNTLEIEKIKHGRFTLPATNMILLLLGLSFFMSRIPENMLTQGGKALGVCAAAFMITFIGQQLMGAGNLPPALPAWLPILLGLPAAALLLDNVKT